ncbi:Crotonase superfamily [Trinorchestia longiramus]|nr:Crotonase superfamily [Trinorchestia longiramus]
MTCFATASAVFRFRQPYTILQRTKLVLVRPFSSHDEELKQARERLWPLGAGNIDLSMNSETGIATLVLRQPDKKNALSGRMMVQLADAVTELENWREGRGLVLRSEGDFFCSGGDLTTVESINNPSDGRLMCTLMQDTTTRLHRLPLVSVSIVHGRAIGGGAELVTATDFRLFTLRGNIQFVQGAMGVATGWGGGTRLVRLLGPQKAMDLLLTARRCDAEEAFECGLSNFMLKTNNLYEETLSWMQNRIKFQSEIIAAIKNIVHGATGIYIDSLILACC